MWNDTSEDRISPVSYYATTGMAETFDRCRLFFQLTNRTSHSSFGPAQRALAKLLRLDQTELKTKANYFTKVIAQSLQFLPDNTTRDTVVEKGKVIDEGEFELSEVS